MTTLAEKANRAAAAVAEAVTLQHQLAQELSELIPDADPETRHALLRLRVEINAAGSELGVAAGRVNTISANLGYLAGKNKP